MSAPVIEPRAMQLKKSLLIVTPTYVSYHVFLRELTSRLVADSWQVMLATSTTNYPYDNVDRDSIQLQEIDFPRGVNLLGYWRAARQLRQLVIDRSPLIVHAHIHPAILAVALAKQSGWPSTLGTYQGLVSPMLDGARAWVYRSVERWASRNLDKVWVLTPGDAAVLPYTHVHLQAAPGFGADQNRFNPGRFTDGDRQQQRAELGIPGNATVFVFVGRKTRFKGYAETLSAALEAVEQRTDLHFLFVGTADPKHPTGVTPDVEKAADSHPQIHTLGWVEDVPRLLNACDCFVFPSEREGMAVSIMEALSMGLPVITTNARGCGELVEDGHNGWIVSKDQQAILQRVLAVHDDPQGRSDVAANAIAEREKWSRQRFIEELLDYYQQIAVSKARG